MNMPKVSNATSYVQTPPQARPRRGRRRVRFAGALVALVLGVLVLDAHVLVGQRSHLGGPAMAKVQGPGQTAGRNVLIIVADDLGIEALSAYGLGANPAHTPTLDALATEGLVFDQAWGYPVCTPFRAAALTGRFGFRTGVGTQLGPKASVLPLSETIIPEVLDAHEALGVAHAAIGKWHISGAQPAATAPNDHGFSHYAGVLAGVLSSYYSWERVVDGLAQTETGYATTVQTNDALSWISAQGAKPWFMWLAYNAPHDPYHRPPEGLYTTALPAGDPPRMGKGARPFYLAAIEAMDAEIGRLLATMDAATRARTTVIFMGDNGSPKAVLDAPFRADGAKSTLYQGGIRVPLIVSGAGVTAPGRRVAHLVDSADLFATTLDLLGLPAASWPRDIDGQSILPYLASPDAPAQRDWAFSELFGSGTDDVNGKTIRDLRYKYIRFDDGHEAFFDLQSDPYEQRELLAAGPSSPESAALDALRARLAALLANPPMTATPRAGAAASSTPGATASVIPSITAPPTTATSPATASATTPAVPTPTPGSSPSPAPAPTRVYLPALADGG